MWHSGAKRPTTLLPLLLLCLVWAVPAAAWLQLEWPPSLQRTLQVSWSTFGPPPVANVVPRGQLVAGDDMEGCRPVESLPALGTPTALTCARRFRPTCVASPRGAFGAVAVFVRGGCTFAEKARNVQNATTHDGWPVVAALVINRPIAGADPTTVGEFVLPHVADDGAGYASRIRSGVLTTHEGRTLLALLGRSARLLPECPAADEECDVLEAEHPVPHVILELGARL